ncbi:hypothetical protein DDP54_09145 [Cellulomonas sp. WB94]|nr:hypothetical protein DDP54_09145 [Cellulomonas sp. WB94]
MGRPAPEPGWYTDPQGAGTRWWDGQGWTEHTQQPQAAVATAEPTFVPNAPAAPWTPSYGTVPTFPPSQTVVGNTPAIVGFVISLAAIPVGVLTGIWFASLIGALVSGRGLSRARKLAAEGYGPVGRSVISQDIGDGSASGHR